VKIFTNKKETADKSPSQHFIFFPHPRKLFSDNFQTFSNIKEMAKTKGSKPAASAPEKKNGNGGRVTKPSTVVEKTKAAAKAVVAASSAATEAASEKVKSILKEPKVDLLSWHMAN
jgi:hypothetical protein